MRSTKPAERNFAQPSAGVCKHCRRPILWATTAKALTPIPLDPTPSDAGYYWIAPATGLAFHMDLHQVEKVKRRGGELRTCHLSTCAFRPRHNVRPGGFGWNS